MTIRQLASSARKATLGIRPLEIKVDRNAEEALMTHFWGKQRPGSQEARRKFIERQVSLEKPSGIEIILWNQNIVGFGYWISDAIK